MTKSWSGRRRPTSNARTEARRSWQPTQLILTLTYNFPRPFFLFGVCGFAGICTRASSTYPHLSRDRPLVPYLSLANCPAILSGAPIIKHTHAIISIQAVAQTPPKIPPR